MSATATIIVLSLALVIISVGRIAGMWLRKRTEEQRRAYDKSQQTIIASLETLRDALHNELTAKNKLIEVLTETHALFEQRIEHQLSTINALREQVSTLEGAYQFQGDGIIEQRKQIKELSRDAVELRNKLAGYRQKLGEDV